MTNQICIPCGVKYLTEEELKRCRVVTCFNGKCRDCGEVKLVTSIRHYNYCEKKER